QVNLQLFLEHQFQSQWFLNLPPCLWWLCLSKIFSPLNFLSTNVLSENFLFTNFLLTMSPSLIFPPLFADLSREMPRPIFTESIRFLLTSNFDFVGKCSSTGLTMLPPSDLLTNGLSRRSCEGLPSDFSF